MGGAWAELGLPQPVLGVKKQHFSLPAQYDDVTINPTWRTAAILKIVLYPYLSRESSEYDEIWYADANFDPIDGNVRKFPNSRWRTDAILTIIFGYNSAPYCPIKTKFGVRRHNRMRTKVR